MVVQPLYGHTSPETAYVVPDYPYGFRLRCSIRYWLESHPKKGFRFCSQTSNPKRGDIWNAPKKSTYQLFAGCMYLDEKGHVSWDGLSEYSDVKKFEEFFTNFPGLQLTKEQGSFITYAIVSKIAICRGLAAGKSVFSLNGVPQIPSETQVEQAKKDLESWEKVKTALSLVLHKF